MNEKIQKQLEFVTGSKDYPRYGDMTLSRCKMDCQFYLGYGNRNKQRLYMGDPKDHIAFMKELWKHLEEKPEWLTWEQIEDFERQMVQS